MSFFACLLRIVQSQTEIGIIVWIGVIGGNSGYQALSTVEDVYGQYYSKYPFLSTAVLIFQFVVGASVLVWVYTAWVLYNREPGTLGIARKCFVAGSLLRVAGNFVIPLSVEFPAKAVEQFISQAMPGTVFILLITAAFYMYYGDQSKLEKSTHLDFYTSSANHRHSVAVLIFFQNLVDKIPSWVLNRIAFANLICERGSSSLLLPLV